MAFEGDKQQTNFDLFHGGVVFLGLLELMVGGFVALSGVLRVGRHFVDG